MNSLEKDWEQLERHWQEIYDSIIIAPLPSIFGKQKEVVLMNTREALDHHQKGLIEAQRQLDYYTRRCEELSKELIEELRRN